MCVSRTSLRGAIGEAEFEKQILLKADEFYGTHEIILLKPTVEGAPFDRTVLINGKTYRFQVKTTFKFNKNKLVFDTSHSGKCYNEKEIDFFFLYHRNPVTKEEWWGIALPSECLTKTTFTYGEIPGDNVRLSRDYDFDQRFYELLETGTILPIPELEDTEFEEYGDIPSEPLDLTDENTFFSLLNQYGYNLDAAAHALHMTPKAFMKYHTRHVGQGPPCAS